MGGATKQLQPDSVRNTLMRSASNANAMTSRVDNDTGRLRARVLADGQVARVHFATLEVLERTGVVVHHSEARDMLAGAGATIAEKNRVKLPAWLVEKALASAPSRVVLCNRNGERKLLLERERCYFGCSTDCFDYLDPVSGARRLFKPEDGRDMALVADFLPNISFANRAGWGIGIREGLRERIQFKQLLTILSKPMGIGCGDIDVLRDVLAMAEIVVGGREALARAPFVFHTAEPTSPLQHGQDALDRLFLCADWGIPFVYYPMPMMGTSTPASFASTLAVGSAEVLSGLVLHQLRDPGAPFIYGSISTIMDMRSGVCSYGAPEMDLMVAAMTQLSHYYGLPMYGTAGCSDAPEVDAQAGAEVLASVLFALLSGANLVHDVGLIGHCTAVGPEMLVLADEIIEMARRACQAIEVSDETLLLDQIDRVGPGGSHLAEEHTLTHFRQIWHPTLFTRARESADHLVERARARALEIIRKYEPQPLPDDIARELDTMEQHWRDTL